MVKLFFKRTDESLAMAEALASKYGYSVGLRPREVVLSSNDKDLVLTVEEYNDLPGNYSTDGILWEITKVQVCFKPNDLVYLSTMIHRKEMKMIMEFEQKTGKRRARIARELIEKALKDKDAIDVGLG